MTEAVHAQPELEGRSLFAVIFEVTPDPERQQDYLRIAAELKPMLSDIDGFVENERFRSRSRPGTLLSLSLWDDEAALVRWRTAERHNQGQSEGRAAVLRGYHLRVGEIAFVEGRHGARRVGWQRRDSTSSTCKAITLIDSFGGDVHAMTDLGARLGPLSAETFDHLTDGRRSLSMWAWPSLDLARTFSLAMRSQLGPDDSSYDVRVLRDYSMHDRLEAPQYFPAVKTSAESSL